MGQGKRLKAMLLIEGKTVPFISATCSSRVGQPSTAQIEMVPLKEIHDILPRTMVHIFVKDYTYPWNNKPWILAFEGEVYGYSLGKTPKSRSFNLLCMGLSNYWDNAKQSYVNLKTAMSSPMGFLHKQEVSDKANKENTKFVENFGSIKSYLVKLINDKLTKGGNEAFLEAILDVLKGIEEVNPFFRYNNLRYRITDKIGFQSSGNISEIFDFTQKEQFFEAITGRGNGGTVTVRQIVNMLMGLIFHQFISAPFPSKIPAPEGMKGAIGKDKNKTIGSFLFKPDSFMMPPPKCNVLYPDQYNTFGFSRNFFHEVSRVDFRPGPLAADIALNLQIPRVYQQTYHAPSGYSDYQQKKEVSQAEGDQFGNPGVKGNFGDELKDSKSASVLKEFHFMSYEEILKGIFSDQGNMMPSAQVLSKVAKIGSQGKFFQRATDFMFFKKRLASRMTSVAGPLNFSPMPGFPVLILDDSDAQQNIIGNLDGITHTISATGGGFTQYEVSFGRLVEEKDLWSGKLSEPPIPPWYSKTVFGERRKLNSTDYANLPKSYQSRVKDLGYVNDFGNSEIKDFYAALLGNSREGDLVYLGASPITSKKYPNIVSATLGLLAEYRWAKSKGEASSYIDTHTRRDYVYLNEVFEFLGATIKPNQKWATYTEAANIVYTGTTFDGNYVNKAENETAKDLELKSLFQNEAITKRRAPLVRYRQKLFNERGFRG